MIKKYGPWALAAIFVFLFVIKKDYKAEYYGEMAKVKVEKQLFAEQKTLTDWYAADRAKLIAIREDDKVKLALVGADAIKFHAESVAKDKKISNLLTCNEQLVAKNALLVECQNYVLELNQNYENRIDELDTTNNQILALNLRELGELRLVNKNLIVRVGDCAKKITILESTKQNRLNFAIFGGVDLLHKDVTFGVGLSFNLFPIKFRLF